LAQYPNAKIVEALTQKIRQLENVLDTKDDDSCLLRGQEEKRVDFDEFARGFVLLKVKPSRETHSMMEVLKINEVIEAHLIIGSFDVLAF